MTEGVNHVWGSIEKDTPSLVEAVEASTKSTRDKGGPMNGSNLSPVGNIGRMG